LRPITGNRFWLGLLLLGTSITASGADIQVKAGGVVLTMPGPAPDFTEVGDKLRTTFFELLAPSTNRLLSAYVPAQTLGELNQGKALGGLEMYSMVEVPRKAEYSDLTPQAFDQLAKAMNPGLAQLDTKKAGEFQDEIDVRLKALGGKPIKLGEPEVLGSIFQKTDSSGFAMLMGYKQDDRTVTMAMGMAVLRVKQRLIFAYLFRRYESPDTVSWIRENLEAWTDAILSKN
jgi:hypothetical protein